MRTGGADLACARFGHGEPLLCAHALAFSKEVFVAAAGVLGSSFDCVAVDLRGHGETHAAGGDDAIAVDAMSEDLRAVLDQVGWDSAIAGGTSLGAAVTLVLARRHPHRVRALIQDLPGFGPRSTRDPERADEVAEAFDRADLDEAARRAARSLPPARARALAAALREQWRPFPPADLGPKLASAFRATSRWTIFSRWPDDLAAISTPTHVLGLAGDATHPLAIAEVMAATLPRARLWPRVPSLLPDAVARQWVRVAQAPVDPSDPDTTSGGE